MTMNPNARVSDLHTDEKSLTRRRADDISVGSFFAAAFILGITLIARVFYK